VLCSLLWVTLLRQGVGLGDPQRALPTPNILWFCDSFWECPLKAIAKGPLASQGEILPVPWLVVYRIWVFKAVEITWKIFKGNFCTYEKKKKRLQQKASLCELRSRLANTYLVITSAGSGVQRAEYTQAVCSVPLYLLSLQDPRLSFPLFRARKCLLAHGKQHLEEGVSGSVNEDFTICSPTRRARRLPPAWRPSRCFWAVWDKACERYRECWISDNTTERHLQHGPEKPSQWKWEKRVA